MSLHQYIGARYVPIFYQNSLDPTSTEWEANVTYEPLTWVSTLNGNMYLSKKTVPANAGAPASTPEYWMEAGQFNGYIQGLQDQIDDMKDGTIPGSLQDQINDMKDGTIPGSLQDQINDIDSAVSTIKTELDILAPEHYVVTIGDSYFNGMSDNNYELAAPWIAQQLNKTVNTNLFNYSKGGLAFVGSGTNDVLTWFNTVIEPTIPQNVRDKTRSIIIGLGYNEVDRCDGSAGAIASIETNITAFMNRLHQVFTDCTIYLANIYSGWQSHTDASKEGVALAYSRASAKNKCVYLGTLGDVLKIGAGMPLILSDGIHPTQEGVKELGRSIGAAILSGQYHINMMYSTVSPFHNFRACTDNGTLTIEWKGLNFLNTPSISDRATVDFDGQHVTGTLDTGLNITGQNTIIARATIFTMVSIDTNPVKNYVSPVNIDISGTGIISLKPLTIENNAYVNGMIKSLYMLPFQVSLPLYEL